MVPGDVRRQDRLPQRSTPQTDIWLIQEEDEKVGWKTKGALATYVDDVLMVGEEDIILGFIEQVQTHWKIGEPEWVVEGREPEIPGNGGREARGRLRHPPAGLHHQPAERIRGDWKRRFGPSPNSRGGGTANGGPSPPGTEGDG